MGYRTEMAKKNNFTIDDKFSEYVEHSKNFGDPVLLIDKNLIYADTPNIEYFSFRRNMLMFLASCCRPYETVDDIEWSFWEIVYVAYTTKDDKVIVRGMSRLQIDEYLDYNGNI